MYKPVSFQTLTGVFTILLLFCQLSLVSLSVRADDKVLTEKNISQLENYSRQIKVLSKKLSRGSFDGDDLTEWTKVTINAGSAADLCISNVSATLEDINTALEGLGDAVKGESVDVSRKRNAYKKQKAALEKQLARCNVIKLNSAEASKLISTAEKSYFKQKYLVRGHDVITLVSSYLENPVSLLSESTLFLWNKSGIREIDIKEAALSSLAIALAVLFSFWLRRQLLKLEARRQWNDDFTENFLRALLTTSAFSAPYILTASALTISTILVTHVNEQWSFLSQLSLGLLVYFSVVAAIRLVFSPYPPAKLYISFTPVIAKSLSRRLRILAVLGLVGYLAFYTVFSESVQHNNLVLLRMVFSLFFVLNVIWTLAVIIRSPRLPKLRWLSFLVIIALVLTLIAEMAGYRNLAFSGRRIILFSFVLFIVFVGIAKIFRDIFNMLDEGKYSWGRRLHRNLGLEPGDKVPGLIWLRLTTAIIIWGSFAFLFINTWDYSGGVIETIRSYLVNGFDIGNFRIVPGRILWALLIFGLILIISSWIRSQMENNWLKMTGMDSGSRDTLVTLTGYLFFVVALLAGLSAAGFDFGNITIIAGALSVGIGFGLQTIVNNFVSGLILLFERPIRKGDWIVVGGTEGVVKDIQIRSTRIQTFDRADIIVPNSELISNQVTNWVLSSKSGRAIIPVGVAYGSDTAQVREILLKVAEENENVAKNANMPQPRVLFRAFGDSSLDFELRVFLHQVDSRLSVISELNFAIDKAFREANIEIPFPQRDLHVRSMPASLPAEAED